MEHNTIEDNPFTRRDVCIAKKKYGPDVPALKGKTVKQQQQQQQRSSKFNTLIIVLFLLYLCCYYNFYISVLSINHTVQLYVEEVCHRLCDWVVHPLSRKV